MKGCQRVHSLKPQLLGLVGRRRNDEKDLVRRERPVRQLLSRHIDEIAGSQYHFSLCGYRNWDIWRYGDRLNAVLIFDYQSGGAAFLYSAVRHAGVRYSRTRD